MLLSSPSPAFAARARSGPPCWKILPGADLTAYELELLAGQHIPQALKLRLVQDGPDRLITVEPPLQGECLLRLDGRGKRQQDLGLFRILSILEVFQDAEERLLRPSFDYLSLDSIYLYKGKLTLPILPLGPGQALRLPAQQIYSEFWSAWAEFYQVQKELAELGRRLAGPGQYRKLAKLFQEALANSSYQAGRFRGTKPLRWQDPCSTQELACPPGEGSGAELFYLGPDDRPGPQKKRLALILGQEFILGRDPAFADLCFHDPWIGRQHARFIRESGYFYLEDLASLNGTFVDGRRLLRHENLLLPDRCDLRLGKTHLGFQVLGTQPTWYQRAGHPHHLSQAQYRPGH